MRKPIRLLIGISWVLGLSPMAIGAAVMERIESLLTANAKRVQVEYFQAALFGGQVSGRMAFSPDTWQRTQVSLTWEDVDLRGLSRWWPNASPWLAVTSGRLDIRPADERRPLEPLVFDAEITVREGPFDNVDLEPVRVAGAIGSRRILLTKLHLPVFDGLIEARARMSKKDDTWFLYANCTLVELDLNRAVNAFSRQANDIAGRLSGDGFFTASTQMDDMSGTVTLSLQKSELAANPIIGTLYNTLNLQRAGDEPSGQGRVQLRFAGKRLQVADFYYYNRGVEIAGSGTVQDFAQGADSPVDGTVLAATRPLKELNLPGVDTLDRVMYFAQKDMAAVRIGGTVDELEIQVTALPQVRSFFKKFFGGDNE